MELSEQQELTPKQELFCQEYLVDLVATKAYMRAFDNTNYASSAVEASKLIKNPNVSARIKQLMAERVERLNINQDYVLLSLIDIREKSSISKPVLEWNPQTKQMEETGEYTYDSNGAVRASELLGKHMGMFKDKVEHSGEVGIQPIILKGEKFSSPDGKNNG